MEVLVVLFGLFVIGSVATVVWRYRRSRRMAHIVPLGISYLVLVMLSLESFWSGYRSVLRWDGLLLIGSYGCGLAGILLLLSTSTSLGRD